MNSDMCPDQLRNRDEVEDIPVPSLREVLVRLQKRGPLHGRNYKDAAKSASAAGGILYGANTWYENNTLYAGLSDGVVKFDVSDSGAVSDWFPVPVAYTQVNTILRDAHTKAATFNAMLRARTVNN